MSVDLTNAFAVVAYVKSMEEQAEKAVQDKDFRAANVYYREILQATYGYLGELMKRNPNVLDDTIPATDDQVYLSESSERWLQSLTKVTTEMLSPEDKEFLEPFNEFHFQNPMIVDAATLIADAKKHLNEDKRALLENYVEGKAPRPVVQIMQDFATGKTTRKEALRRLNGNRERFKKCMRQLRGLMMLDTLPPATSH